MMPTDKEVNFYFKSSDKVVQLELFQVTHPEFSEPYRFVRNATKGITLPNGDFFQYYPAKVKRQTDENSLDYGVKVSLGDMSQVLPPEIKRMRETNTLGIKPSLSHWLYRSDDLSEPMKSLELLELENFSFNNSNSYFIAKAPSLNNTKTGKTYTIEDFPMLESFLK